MSVSLKKMHEICDITSSKRIYAKEYQSEGIPFFRGKEIVEKFNGALSVSTELYISENKFEEVKGRFGVPVKGDLLLTSVGTIGVPYYVEGKFEFYFKDGNLTWFKNINGIKSKYLYYWLISSAGRAELSKCQIGAAQPAYTIVKLKEMEISIPSELIQEKVVDIISTYNNLIENNNRRIALLEESARLLYQEWFVHLRFTGHEHCKIIDGVPEGWTKTTANEVLDVMSGGTPKTKVPSFWDGEIPFFTPKDATNNPFVYETEKTITEEGLSKCNSKLYPKNTVFITARGTVGKINLAQRPMAMNQSCYALAGKNGLSNEYLYFALKASVSEFKSRAGGAVFDAIVVDTFKLIPITIPQESILNEFNKTIELSLNQIESLVTTNRALVKARDILLPRLMNGEIVV